jgi:hypothetical protein
MDIWLVVITPESVDNKGYMITGVYDSEQKAQIVCQELINSQKYQLTELHICPMSVQ